MTNKITPPSPLDDSAFIRRVYLDLIGLLPAESELEAFAANKATDKRTKLIELLLNENRSYADHWLAFWNDLLRNEYRGTGYIDGGRKQITAWLYKSLLENKRYDQFARELINPTPESEGFAKGDQVAGTGERQPDSLNCSFRRTSGRFSLGQISNVLRVMIALSITGSSTMLMAWPRSLRTIRFPHSAVTSPRGRRRRPKVPVPRTPVRSPMLPHPRRNGLNNWLHRSRHQS